MKTKKTIITTLLVSALALTAQTQATPDVPVFSSFDGNLDGWVATGSDFVYLNMGGDPDGYLRHNDSTRDSNMASAPEKYLGDWTSLNKTGIIVYNHRVFQTGDNATPGPYHVMISGPGGAAQWLGEIPSVIDEWVTVQVPLKKGEWTVQSGTWEDLLANVDKFKIQVEQFGNPGSVRDQNGIDNVFLGQSDSVPEFIVECKPAISFLSKEGVTYLIESSEDGVNYEHLTTIAGTGNYVSYTDTRDTTDPQRSYRLSIVEE